jgi:antitoxin component YwqK of YwqJK toxin-antitoxin module
MRYLILILFFILTYSCNEQPIINIDDTIVLEDSMYFKKDTTLVTGLVKEWDYGNGQLSWGANIKVGKRDGLVRGWYENGQLWFEINNKNNIPDGLTRYWYEDGRLKSEENWKNGVLVEK